MAVTAYWYQKAIQAALEEDGELSGDGIEITYTAGIEEFAVAV